MEIIECDCGHDASTEEAYMNTEGRLVCKACREDDKMYGQNFLICLGCLGFAIAFAGFVIYLLAR